jgi:branched-subunit amino acid aminotransferase/4-amino-4-deoxychorismate lyase
MGVQLFAVTERGAQALRVPEGARSVHDVFDGLSLGVYSALRTFEHERFLGLELHFERTDRSLALLGSSERLDRPALARALHEAVRGHPEPEAFVRFDVLAAAPASLGTEARTLIALSPFVPVPEQFLREGVAVRVSSLRRSRPLIKLASFVLERRPYPLGRPEAYEHLILDGSGRILEGTSSNFLALRGRSLHLTGDEALQGVTQRLVATLAVELGLECVREPLRRADLSGVDEAFLTSSSRGLVPVVAVEGQRIGTGIPGPWTRRLTEAYYAHARAHARPAVVE